MRADLGPGCEPHDAGVSHDVDADRFLRCEQLGAETARLCGRLTREVRTGQPGRKAEVVLDPRARARLAAERQPLDDDGAQPSDAP